MDTVPVNVLLRFQAPCLARLRAAVADAPASVAEGNQVTHVQFLRQLLRDSAAVVENDSSLVALQSLADGNVALRAKWLLTRTKEGVATWQPSSPSLAAIIRLHATVHAVCAPRSPSTRTPLDLFMADKRPVADMLYVHP